MRAHTISINSARWRLFFPRLSYIWLRSVSQPAIIRGFFPTSQSRSFYSNANDASNQQSLQDKIEELRKLFEATQAKNNAEQASSQQAINQLHKQLQELKDEKNKEKDQLKTQLDFLQKNINQLHEELQKVKNNSSKDKDQWKTELDSLQKTINQLYTELQELKAKQNTGSKSNSFEQFKSLVKMVASVAAIASALYVFIEKNIKFEDQAKASKYLNDPSIIAHNLLYMARYREDFIPRDIIEIIVNEEALINVKDYVIFLEYTPNQSDLKDLDKEKKDKINARANTTLLDKVSKRVAIVFNKDVIKHVLDVKEIDNESVKKVQAIIVALSAFSHNNKNIKHDMESSKYFQELAQKFNMKTTELVTKITDVLCQGSKMLPIIRDKFPDKIEDFAQLGHAVYDNKQFYNFIYSIIQDTSLEIGEIKPLANFGITPSQPSTILSKHTTQTITQNGEDKQR
jgi:hypothetical protein